MVIFSSSPAREGVDGTSFDPPEGEASHWCMLLNFFEEQRRLKANVKNKDLLNFGWVYTYIFFKGRIPLQGRELTGQISMRQWRRGSLPLMYAGQIFFKRPTD